MTNIKKIGLSALAGALAMTSAHAGALSVAGNMEISYTKGSNETTSNPLGQANDITLTASTELDNGITVAYKNTSSDTTLTGDSELVFGNILGGTLAMTSTGSPLSAIDNKTPTAFKDATDMVGSITDVNGSDGTYGIRYTLSDVAGSGIKLDYMYFPVHGTGDAAGDESWSGGGHGSSDAHEVTLTGAVPYVEGLNVGAGYYKANYQYLQTFWRNEAHEGTVYATYAAGPVTVGYQVGAKSTAGLNGAGYKNTYMGISYAVSDDLSISYVDAVSQKTNVALSKETEQDWNSIGLSYSMGGMTLNLADASCGNCTYTAAKSQDERTISMTIAF